MKTNTYSRWYVAGWSPLLVLLALPIVEFPDVPTLAVVGVVAVVALGYVLLKAAQRQTKRQPVLNTSAKADHYARAAIVFSVLSIIGCQLVLREQASFLGESSFDNLQERYIALVESSLEGTSTSSVWSSLGNLMRAFFFVAVTSFVIYTKEGKSLKTKLLIAFLVVFALLENFQANVSRLQLVFFLFCAVITAVMVKHPLLRFKKFLIAAFAALILFLIVTTSQRFDAKFADSETAAGYIATFFGVNTLPLGQSLVNQFGAAAFSLSIYVTQGIPELVRLVSNNDSPYSLGAHSLFLVLSPVLRLFGVPIDTSGPALSNQGFWWGFMGDLYIDFGWLFPLAYLVTLTIMVRVANRFGTGPVYGSALRVLTAGMIMIVPYTGIFNSYSVSYFGILAFAIHEKSSMRRQRISRTTTSPQHAHTPTTSLRT